MDAFLTAFRDEFPKIPCLSVPLLSHILPGTLEADEVSMNYIPYLNPTGSGLEQCRSRVWRA